MPRTMQLHETRNQRGSRCVAVAVMVAAAHARPVQADPTELRALVDAIGQKRCAEVKQYQMIGGVPCSQAASTGGAKDPDAVLKDIGESVRQKVTALSLQARKEDAACARGLVAGAGGTSVGANTPQALADQLVKAALDDAMNLTLPVGMMLSIPGVTQVQYDYKGLRNGPEIRMFKITGRVEGDPEHAKLRLRMDGDVEGDKNLYLQYTVNYHKTQSPFPAWSPFLDAAADIRPAIVRQRLTTLSSTAKLEQRGSQRNGVKVWHEYEYTWQAERIGLGSNDVVKSRSSNAYADLPYGGDWVGIGWGSETRFKQTRTAFVSQLSPRLAGTMEGADGVMMSVNVKHQTVFYFHVDVDGNVTGRGSIVYTLDPYLCPVATLTRQVNEAVNLMKWLPAIYLATSQLNQRSVRRFEDIWVPESNTITMRMDEVLSKLPRIERAAGEAEINAFTAARSALPRPGNAHYAFAEVEIENVSVKRMWGIAGDTKYPGVKLAPGEEIAPPTPVDANGRYAGRFETRPGRRGWFEDGTWYEQAPGKEGTPFEGPGWDRRDMNVKNWRGNDSELRIFEELIKRLSPGARGTIKLFSQLPPCSSCAGVIEQFSAMFPDILIVVTSGL